MGTNFNDSTVAVPAAMLADLIGAAGAMAMVMQDETIINTANEASALWGRALWDQGVDPQTADPQTARIIRGVWAAQSGNEDEAKRLLQEGIQELEALMASAGMTVVDPSDPSGVTVRDVLPGELGDVSSN